MAHARTQIRDAVVALLGATPYRVTPGRVYPEPDPLPALSVYTDNEETDQEADDVSGERWQIRHLALRVDGRVKVSADIEDELDAVCLDVEVALGGDPELGGLAQWMEIRATEYQLSAEEEQPIGLASIVYQIDYRVDRADPAIIVP